MRNRSPHHVPATAKLLAALLTMVATMLIPPSVRWWPAALLATLLAIAAFARLSLRALLRRFALAEPFVLGVALLSLLQPGGARIFAFMVIRSTLCVLTMILVACTTSFSDLAGALGRLGLPSIAVSTFTLMVRYIAVLGEEAARMRRARASRTFTPGRRVRWELLADVAARLFIRASERAERIYAAMCARGWQA